MDNHTIILVVVNIIAIALILSKKEYRNYFLERPLPTILAILAYVVFLYWYIRKPRHPPPLPDSATCNYCCFSPGHGITVQPWMCYGLKNINASWGYCKEWAYAREARTVACCDTKKINGTTNNPPNDDDECIAFDQMR